jgi:hypothetical protein
MRSSSFLSIISPVLEADRLVSIKTPVATWPEVHAMEEEGGFIKMRSASNSSSSRDLLEAAQHAENHKACEPWQTR